MMEYLLGHENILLSVISIAAGYMFKVLYDAVKYSLHKKQNKEKEHKIKKQIILDVLFRIRSICKKIISRMEDLEKSRSCYSREQFSIYVEKHFSSLKDNEIRILSSEGLEKHISEYFCEYSLKSIRGLEDQLENLRHCCQLENMEANQSLSFDQYGLKIGNAYENSVCSTIIWGMRREVCDILRASHAVYCLIEENYKYKEEYKDILQKTIKNKCALGKKKAKKRRHARQRSSATIPVNIYLDGSTPKKGYY